MSDVALSAHGDECLRTRVGDLPGERTALGEHIAQRARREPQAHSLGVGMS